MPLGDDAEDTSDERSTRRPDAGGPGPGRRAALATFARRRSPASSRVPRSTVPGRRHSGPWTAHLVCHDSVAVRIERAIVSVGVWGSGLMAVAGPVRRAGPGDRTGWPAPGPGAPPGRGGNPSSKLSAPPAGTAGARSRESQGFLSRAMIGNVIGDG